MRYIRDRYELRDDDLEDDGWGESPSYSTGRRRGLPAWAALLIFALVLGAGAAIGMSTVNARERDDRFCLGCHTAPEETYHQRSLDALDGTLAADLSSKHYQQIRGQGGQVRCVSCHLGDGGARAQAEKQFMTAGHGLLWLLNQNDVRLQKTAITMTVSNNLTQTFKMGTLAPRALSLSNEGCVSCHQNILLLAGQANHAHNMLPPAYALWKGGARLIAPPTTPITGTQNAQAIITRGLTQFATTVQCSSCHQTHRAAGTEFYLDPIYVAQGCTQCHKETGKGPATTPSSVPKDR